MTASTCSMGPAPDRGRGAWAVVGRALVLALLSACRIYREELPVAGDEAGHAGQGGERSASPRDERPGVAATPASEALDLWVLNRPRGDLTPQLATLPAEPAAAAARSKAMVVVVLGFGPPEPCADQLARQALAALDAGTDPLGVAAALLDGARRARWPQPENSFSAILRGSDGRFGGIQRAPAGALSADVLVASLSRQVLIDGARLRSATTAAEPRQQSPLSPCSASTHGSLEGASGVLIRTEAGFLWGGLVSPDLPADAGVLSPISQYGVSVAVGSAGGVLMITDCSSPPAQRIAERVYASSDWVAAAAGREVPGACRVGHALLAGERAWVQSSSPLAWAALDLEAKTAPTAQSPARATDAGAPQAPATGSP